MEFQGTFYWLSDGSYSFADVRAVEQDNYVRFECHWEQYSYVSTVFSKKPGYFKGSIVRDNEVVGVLSLWKFNWNDQIIFQGNWEEPDYGGDYKCFIHLTPLRRRR